MGEVYTGAGSTIWRALHSVPGDELHYRCSSRCRDSLALLWPVVRFFPGQACYLSQNHLQFNLPDIYYPYTPIAYYHDRFPYLDVYPQAVRTGKNSYLRGDSSYGKISSNFHKWNDVIRGNVSKLLGNKGKSEARNFVACNEMSKRWKRIRLCWFISVTVPCNG